MKERVREIARQARRSDKGQREFGYYKNVVQVEFQRMALRRGQPLGEPGRAHLSEPQGAG